MSTSTAILERNVRAWVARGSGIESQNVRLGRTSAVAPDGLYAVVTLIASSPNGMITRRQVIKEDRSYVIHSQAIDSMFDIQFFREGAQVAANLFGMWARSESGTTHAATALTCGRLAGVNIYEGGSGYTHREPVEFPHNEGESGNRARGVLWTNSNGGAIRVQLTNAGSGYSSMPSLAFGANSAGTGATGAPRGYGFTINQIKVRNLTDVESEEYEDRAQIDLDIRHSVVYNDTESGRVETIVGDYPTIT